MQPSIGFLRSPTPRHIFFPGLSKEEQIQVYLDLMKPSKRDHVIEEYIARLPSHKIPVHAEKSQSNRNEEATIQYLSQLSSSMRLQRQVKRKLKSLQRSVSPKVVRRNVSETVETLVRVKYPKQKPTSSWTDGINTRVYGALKDSKILNYTGKAFTLAANAGVSWYVTSALTGMFPVGMAGAVAGKLLGNIAVKIVKSVPRIIRDPETGLKQTAYDIVGVTKDTAIASGFQALGAGLGGGFVAGTILAGAFTGLIAAKASPRTLPKNLKEPRHILRDTRVKEFKTDLQTHRILEAALADNTSAQVSEANKLSFFQRHKSKIIDGVLLGTMASVSTAAVLSGRLPPWETFQFVRNTKIGKLAMKGAATGAVAIPMGALTHIVNRGVLGVLDKAGIKDYKLVPQVVQKRLRAKILQQTIYQATLADLVKATTQATSSVVTSQLGGQLAKQTSKWNSLDDVYRDLQKIHGLAAQQLSTIPRGMKPIQVLNTLQKEVAKDLKRNKVPTQLIPQTPNVEPSGPLLPKHIPTSEADPFKRLINQKLKSGLDPIQQELEETETKVALEAARQATLKRLAIRKEQTDFKRIIDAANLKQLRRKAEIARQAEQEREAEEERKRQEAQIQAQIQDRKERFEERKARRVSQEKLDPKELNQAISEAKQWFHPEMVEGYRQFRETTVGQAFERLSETVDPKKKGEWNSVGYHALKHSLASSSPFGQASELYQYANFAYNTARATSWLSSLTNGFGQGDAVTTVADVATGYLDQVDVATDTVKEAFVDLVPESLLALGTAVDEAVKIKDPLGAAMAAAGYNPFRTRAQGLGDIGLGTGIIGAFQDSLATEGATMGFGDWDLFALPKTGYSL